MESTKERILLGVIEKIGELEWKRYRQRYPEMWINDHFEKVDHSCYPPSTSFRFKDETPKVIELLRDILISYKGKIKWSLIEQAKEYGSGVNRCILPTYVKEIQEKEDKIHKAYEYIAEHDPDFGAIAYEDLINLTEYICSEFKCSGFNL